MILRHKIIVASAACASLINNLFYLTDDLENFSVFFGVIIFDAVLEVASIVNSVRQIMKYLITYLMAALLLSAISVDTEMLVVLKHCSNVFNEKYVSKLLTPRKPINRTTSLTSTDIFLKPGVVLDKPLYMRIETFKKFATQYKPTIIDYTVEVCQALNLKTHPLYNFFIDKTNVSEINYLHPCPFEGHLYMTPYYTSYGHMPPLFPTGVWRVEITVLQGKVKVFTLYNHYEVTSNGIEDF